MEVKRIFFEDLQIAKAILDRNEAVTYKYFYKQCYPLFKSIYDNYYTDCENCKEFIDEIYCLVLTPSRKTGKCQMENFKGESTLASWLKTTCLFYCYSKFEAKGRMPIHEPLDFGDGNGKNRDEGDRIKPDGGSIQPTSNNFNREDVLAILKLMPNKRYSELIRLRYLEEYTNEETAEALGMTMENYYNKHKLAKAQYIRIYRKEERI